MTVVQRIPHARIDFKKLLPLPIGSSFVLYGFTSNGEYLLVYDIKTRMMLWKRWDLLPIFDSSFSKSLTLHCDSMGRGLFDLPSTYQVSMKNFSCDLQFEGGLLGEDEYEELALPNVTSVSAEGYRQNSHSWMVTLTASNPNEDDVFEQSQSVLIRDDPFNAVVVSVSVNNLVSLKYLCMSNLYPLLAFLMTDEIRLFSLQMEDYSNVFPLESITLDLKMNDRVLMKLNGLWSCPDTPDDISFSCPFNGFKHSYLSLSLDALMSNVTFYSFNSPLRDYKVWDWSISCDLNLLIELKVLLFLGPRNLNVEIKIGIISSNSGWVTILALNDSELANNSPQLKPVFKSFTTNGSVTSFENPVYPISIIKK